MNKQRLIEAIPFWGILLYFLLYFYSSTLYPGGSQADISSVGFDWINNYWCNLLDEKGMNGDINDARVPAIIAMEILCFSLLLFFWEYGRLYEKNTFWRGCIQYGGLLAMVLAAFIYSPFHNHLILLSSIAGLFPLLGIIRRVYLDKNRGHQLLGLLVLVLMFMNNYIYYSRQYIEILPFLQKISFALVLVWILVLHQGIRRTKVKLARV